MQDEKSLVTAKKQQSPQVQMRAVFVPLISKFQSVITAKRPNTFRPEIYLRSLNGLELTRLPSNYFENTSRFLKWIHKMENFPVNKNHPLFACALTPRPPRLEADRRSKSKQSWNRCNFGLSCKVMNATSCHPSCHRYAALWWTLLSLDQSGVAVAGVTNSVNTRQSEAVTVSLFFPPPNPTPLTPPPLPKGVLFSSQFCSHKETKMAAPSNWTMDIYDLRLTEK